MGPHEPRQLPPPQTGANSQQVIDWLLANASNVEPCEHGPGEFAVWISLRPGELLCAFCHEAAQVLSHDIRCATCGSPAADPIPDAHVIAKVSDQLGAHFYLCGPCAQTDLRSA